MRVQDAASFLLWIALAVRSKNVPNHPVPAEVTAVLYLEITAVKMMLQPKYEQCLQSVVCRIPFESQRLCAHKALYRSS